MKINEQQPNLIKQFNESAASRINKANVENNKTLSDSLEQAAKPGLTENVDYKTEVRSQNLKQHENKVNEEEAQGILNEIMKGFNSMSSMDAESLIGNVNRDNVLALLKD